MKAEEQLTQDVEISAKVVMPNLENEESTTVDSDVWFEIQLV